MSLPHGISRVTTHPVCYPEPNDANALRYLLFVRVESSDGAVGWGEGITQFAGSTAAAEEIVNELKGHVIGQDPLLNIGIMRDLRKLAWWYSYRGGIAQFALSAIDIALWDLKGKLTGQSLIEMIGSRNGKCPERLPVLASTHAFDGNLDREVARHAEYVKAGYLGVKIGMGKKGEARLGYEIDRDVAFVRDLRSAVGPSAWLMMDRGYSLTWTLDEALRRILAWEEANLKWVEEPFEPWEFQHYRVLRQHVTCLIAGAEREWDRRGYEEVIRSETLDVLGCDVGRVGGISGALQVIEMVEAAGLWFNSHAWSSAINTAASIALSASTPRCLLQELKPDESPMQQELVQEPIMAHQGYVSVSKRPGLGIEVNEAVLAKYAAGKSR